MDRGVRMTCAHDPWDDVCADCNACLGCDPHRDYCKNLEAKQ